MSNPNMDQDADPNIKMDKMICFLEANISYLRTELNKIINEKNKLIQDIINM